MELRIQPDDTVDGSVVLVFDKAVVESAGGTDALVDALTGADPGLFDEQPSSGSVETRKFHDGRRTGVEYILTAVPVEEFGAGRGGDLAITREGDNYLVDGVIDLRQAARGAGPGAVAGLADADLSLSVTFPGDVVRSNGRVNGTTVTWEPEAGQVLRIQATGRAAEEFAWPAVVGAGLVALFVVVGLVTWLLLRPR